MSDAVEVKKEYFEVTPLLEKYPKAKYYFLLGSRGCGKTYPVMKKCVIDFLDGKGVFGYVRRHKESLKTSDMQDLCGALDEWLDEYTEHRWNHIAYWQGRWYLEHWQNNAHGQWARDERLQTPIGKTSAMSTWTTSKGPDFGMGKGGISNLIFDEVIESDGSYLTDEWIAFKNTISTYVRKNYEKDTKIWLLANPLSKYAGPYLKNFSIKKQLWNAKGGVWEIIYPNDKGERDTSKGSMSTVFCRIMTVDDANGNAKTVKNADTLVYEKYYAFENSIGKSKAVTHGDWEMADSNKLPSKVYKASNIIQTVYILFGEDQLAMDIMEYPRTEVHYIFVRPTNKSEPYEIPKDTYFYTLDMTLEPNGIIGFGTKHPMTQIIEQIYITGQVYYSDDEAADIFHGFIAESKKRKI